MLNCSAFLSLRPSLSIKRAAAVRWVTFVLGIETSCDDTAVAVVSSRREVLGQSSRSQAQLHNRFGGIVPHIAQRQHQAHIDAVVVDALKESQMTIDDMDAIAVTSRPGLVICLLVGTSHALDLAKKHQKPLLCVHHMRAHALTATFCYPELKFPFLCLLVSGGHCILCLVRGVEDFLILGQSIDTAPGESMDKVARRLRLRHLSPNEYDRISGGRLLEMVASQGNPLRYEFPITLRRRSCDVSFAGLTTSAFLQIQRLETEQGKEAGSFLDDLPDFCASYQHAVFRNLAKRVQRAIELMDADRLMPSEESISSSWERTLVISGGVAANSYIRKGLKYVCSQYGYEVICPPMELCGDNGIMIAWNGLETFRHHPESTDVIYPKNLPEGIWVEATEPIGADMSDKIQARKWPIQNKVKLNNVSAFALV